MRRQRIALSSELTLADSLARLGDQMLYVVLPSHPAAAGIATARLGIVVSANRFVRLVAGLHPAFGLGAAFMLSVLLALGRPPRPRRARIRGRVSRLGCRRWPPGEGTAMWPTSEREVRS